jgi:hypothetical protein
MATITLNKRQAAKVEELTRNAAELAGQAFDDDKARYAAVLRLTNRKRQNGGKYTLTCVPGFAKPAIDAAMLSGKAKPSAKSGKLTCAPDTGDSKRGWQARYANRVKHGTAAKPSAIAPKSIEARMDDLEHSISLIIAMLAK